MTHKDRDKIGRFVSLMTAEKLSCFYFIKPHKMSLVLFWREEVDLNKKGFFCTRFLHFYHQLKRNKKLTQPQPGYLKKKFVTKKILS